MMARAIEYFYDFRSPYSYLAYTQLRLMDGAIVPKPMQILKVMERVGNVPTTITCAAKGRYARTDLGRWAQRYGVMLAHQPRDAWSFLAEVRPFHEVW